MSKHTRAPWHVRDHSRAGLGRNIWVDGGPAIGRTLAGPYKRQILEDEDYPEKLADARLVASAPDLLAAAEKVLRGLNARIDAAVKAGGTSVPVFDGIAELHDAIGKARGAK